MPGCWDSWLTLALTASSSALLASRSDFAAARSSLMTDHMSHCRPSRTQKLQSIESSLRLRFGTGSLMSDMPKSGTPSFVKTTCISLLRCAVDTKLLTCAGTRNWGISKAVSFRPASLKTP
uniref:Putative secreted protein n=1 Tax=Ixodes ricinus TaxID=34613 RepID=A0A6B0UNI5_IXORI